MMLSFNRQTTWFSLRHPSTSFDKLREWRWLSLSKPIELTACRILRCSSFYVASAIDVASRQNVGYAVGQRDQGGALKLWQSLAPVYRQCAVCYTDDWKAYRGVLPKTRHRIVGKNTGKTNHIERFNQEI